MANLKIYSYNSTGFNFQVITFINFLLNVFDIDILLVQEHFVLRDNAHLIANEFPLYNMHFCPALKNNSEINRGRPSGGVIYIVEKGP